ncbi:uncharacterized protein TNIN_115721, partial [Trichonephila inaurata madagascariensis]
TQSIKSPPKELAKKHAPYMYFPDYGKDPKWQELRKKWGGSADQMRIPTAILGESGVFLDSRVISFSVKPTYDKDALISDPVIIFLEHQWEKQKLLRGPSAEELEDPKIESRECVRWSDTLEIPESVKVGGWTAEGCTRVNSTEFYTTCSCDSLGMFALLALPPVPK